MNPENNVDPVSEKYHILRRPFSATFLHYVFPGIIVGAITGLVVGAFRWIIDRSLTGLSILYPFLLHHPIWLIPYILGTLVIVWLIGRIIKPELFDVVGSGVPQVEAILIGKHEMKWWDVLWRKFISGLLTICPGLFLGCEGPCIQIGACIGQGVSEKLYHYDDINERNLLIKCGIAAGLSAAFSAPVAGTIFLLEEVTRHFNFKMVAAAFAAAITADLMTMFYFGTAPCLSLPISRSLPLSAYPWLLVIGIFIGLGGFLFQYGILSVGRWYQKFTILPSYYHSILPLLLVIPVGLWNYHLLGGSHALIIYISQFKVNTSWLGTLGLLLLFLLMRYFGTMMAAGATVAGGIFMPIFVLGSIIGSISGLLLINFNLIPAHCYLNFIAMGMAAYFAAAEGTPFSAILLVTEMVGNVDQILPMSILVFVAYFTSMVLGSNTSIYGALRKEMLHSQKKN